MSFTIWTPLALSSEARDWRGAVWRMVEAQHVASTMKIVDGPDEQDLLESLLEGSKPAPAAAAELHYLLATPFRYAPASGGSRFRSTTDPGVFYAAESVRTACAELAYWRWKFLNDASDLEKLEPVAHTAFRAEVFTRVVDLRQPPFAQDLAAWEHPADYRATQQFAQVAREAGLGGIRYRSVRDPRPAWCIGLLTPSAFSSPKPRGEMQTWWVAVRRAEVVWRRAGESLRFSAIGWAGS